jgi:D-3-phosphoglycerate dehydrogenase
MPSARYPVDDELLDALPRCRIVVRMGTGYDNVDLAAATRHGVIASNIPGSTADVVADHTIALILACHRGIGRLDRALRAGVWDPALVAPITRLRGQTLGFVGFGRIARAVASKMAHFGLTYLAFDPYVARESVYNLGVTPVTFEELLQRSDIVTLHLPATPETRKLFDHRTFSLMKPSAILINTARGHLIDEQALCAALREGRIRCAGLDVFEQEPLSQDNPLLKLDNVLLTPHIGGYSVEIVDEYFRFGHQLISEYLREGKIPQWILNPEVLS